MSMGQIAALLGMYKTQVRYHLVRAKGVTFRRRGRFAGPQEPLAPPIPKVKTRTRKCLACKRFVSIEVGMFMCNDCRNLYHE